MLNLYVCHGNACEEPDVFITKNGNQICTFNIAVPNWNSKEKKSDKTLFIRVKMFGEKLCGKATSLIRKGDTLFIEGHLNPNEYVKKNGEEVKSIEVIASSFYLLRENPKSKISNRLVDTEDDDVPMRQEDQQETEQGQSQEMPF